MSTYPPDVQVDWAPLFHMVQHGVAMCKADTTPQRLMGLGMRHQLNYVKQQELSSM